MALGRTRKTKATTPAKVQPEATEADVEIAEPTLEVESTPEPEAQSQATEKETEVTAPTVTRTRNPIDTSHVAIAPSEDQESSGRNTRLDTDPVAQAVAQAEEGMWYDVRVEDAEDLDDEARTRKINGIKALLRRAGQKYERGISIDPKNHTDKVRFKTKPRRQVKSKAVTSNDVEHSGQVVGEPTNATDVGPTVVNDGGYDYDAEAQTAAANNDWNYDSNAA